MIASQLPAFLAAEALITALWEEGLSAMLAYTFAESGSRDSERQLKIEGSKQAIRHVTDHCTFTIIQER